MADQLTESVNNAMLAIKSLDGDASLRFSEFTGQWYVQARIEISDGSMLKGGTEHRDTPLLAVLSYLDHLKNITLDEVLVAYPTGERRHYRWNGAAFAEQHDSRLSRAENATPDVPAQVGTTGRSPE